MTKIFECFYHRKYLWLLLLCYFLLLININYGVFDAYYPSIGEASWFRIINLLLYTPIYVFILLDLKKELFKYTNRSSFNWLFGIIIIGDISTVIITLLVIILKIESLAHIIDTIAFFIMIFWVIIHISILCTKVKEMEFISLKIFALTGILINVYINFAADIGENNLHSIVFKNPIDFFIQNIPFVFIIVYYHMKYQKIKKPATNN